MKIITSIVTGFMAVSTLFSVQSANAMGFLYKVDNHLFIMDGEEHTLIDSSMLKGGFFVEGIYLESVDVNCSDISQMGYYGFIGGNPTSLLKCNTLDVNDGYGGFHLSSSDYSITYSNNGTDFIGDVYLYGFYSDDGENVVRMTYSGELGDMLIASNEAIALKGNYTTGLLSLVLVLSMVFAVSGIILFIMKGKGKSKR